MLRLAHRIYLGKPQRLLSRIVSVQIIKDIHRLADKAKLSLAAMEAGQGLGEEERITEGMPIQISLGYEENYVLEFDGFINKVENHQDTLLIHAMDGMYRYLKEVPARDYPSSGGSSASLKLILEDLIRDTGSNDSLVLSPRLETLSYQSFHRLNGPALSTLKRLQEDFLIRIYLRNATMYVVSPQERDALMRTRPTLRYAMSRNVIGSTLERVGELSPRRVAISSSHGFEVIGKEVSATTKGRSQEEEQLHLQRQQIKSASDLAHIERHWHEDENYEGMIGYLETWLLPPCTYGQWAALEDEGYPERSGTFFVERVETNFSVKGGRRRVFLSKRIKETSLASPATSLAV